METAGAAYSYDHDTTTAATPGHADDHGSEGVGGEEGHRSVVSQLVRNLLSAVVACVFAIVGSAVGAITGGLIGLATESGLFRGAGVGAISGAVFSLDAVESSLALWHSNGSPIRNVIFVVDIFTSLLSGRLVREKVGPALQKAVQSQMNAVADAPYREEIDIFETGGKRGSMEREAVEKIPKITITSANNVDGSGESICCSVCLQDFEAGETARSLSLCGHMFHLPCIDYWLMKHDGSCPLCRRDL